MPGSGQGGNEVLYRCLADLVFNGTVEVFIRGVYLLRVGLRHPS